MAIWASQMRFRTGRRECIGSATIGSAPCTIKLWEAALRAAMQRIADWLEKLGLAQYTQRFVDNGIDVSVLHHLTIMIWRKSASCWGIGGKCSQPLATLLVAPRQQLNQPQEQSRSLKTLPSAGK